MEEKYAEGHSQDLVRFYSLDECECIQALGMSCILGWGLYAIGGTLMKWSYISSTLRNGHFVSLGLLISSSVLYVSTLSLNVIGSDSSVDVLLYWVCVSG